LGANVADLLDKKQWTEQLINTMKLTIDITREDYSDFNKFHFIKTKLKRSILIGLLTLISMEYFVNRDHFDLTLTIIISIVCIVVYCWATYQGLNKTKNTPDNDGAILGPKEMEFGDDKISYATKNSQGSYDWTSIKYLRESSKAFYLYVDTNMAMLVPKRTFGNENELEDFRKIISKKVPQAT
jgi:Ca2+/Na+ antiporter